MNELVPLAVIGFFLMIATLSVLTCIMHRLGEIADLLRERKDSGPIPAPAPQASYAPTVKDDQRTMWDDDGDSESPTDRQRWIDEYVTKTGQYPDDGWGTDGGAKR